MFTVLEAEQVIVKQAIVVVVAFLIMNTVIADEAIISGEATYLERIALPQNAIFKATLEDVSLMDIPSTIIGSVKISPAGQVPINFEIKYDTEDIQKKHRYTVRGKITTGDRLLFMTDTSFPVLDGKNDGNVQLVMKKVKYFSENKQIAKSIFKDFPMYFLGQLPGANCSSQYQLDLFSDHTYFIRNRCFKNEENITSDDIGRWHVDSSKEQLVLNGGLNDEPKGGSNGENIQLIYFSIIDDKTIEKQNISGGKIDSNLNYRLEASKTARTLEPKVLMVGMYQYMADAALFRECLTGLKLPVLFEKDSPALERAYLNDKKADGALLKVYLEGRIVQRPKMEGEGMQAHLLVERFIKTMSNEHCGNQYVDASFSNTYWKLTSLNGKAVNISSKNREPHIIFRSHQDHDGQYRGTTGCNAISGNYKRETKNITINYNQLAATETLCQDSAIEQSFLQELSSAVYWQIRGDHLELLDSSSQSLARFEAIYF